MRLLSKWGEMRMGGGSEPAIHLNLQCVWNPVPRRARISQQEMLSCGDDCRGEEQMVVVIGATWESQSCFKD